MKHHDYEQGSLDWLTARAGIPTASELGNLITDGFALRKPDSGMVQTYLATKLAERWIGGPIHTFGGGAMEQGSILEDEAAPWYAVAHKVKLRKVGLLTTDDGSFGCSPDRMLDDTHGLEIKCPQPVNHVKWLLDKVCPDEHMLQCQGAMLVTGAEVWKFVSYCRGFPPLVVDVPRKQELQDLIGKALATFDSLIKPLWNELIERNGGSPVAAGISDPIDANDHIF